MTHPSPRTSQQKNAFRNARRALVPSLAALSAIGIVLPVSPADAALVTRCDGEAAGVTVPGDLVVPAGKSCHLTATAIHGSVTVKNGANLMLLDGSSIAGDLTVVADGFAEVVGSSVDGRVAGRNSFSIIVEGTHVTGDIDVRADGTSPFDTTLYALDAVVDGALAARGSEVFVESTTIVGAVDTRNGVLTDVYDSSLYGTLRVQGAELGSIVCESEIDGAGHFASNRYGLQIGGAGQFGTCAGDNYWGSSLTIQGNNGDVLGIDVSDNIVRGTVKGGGNAPAPTGAGNRFRGEVTGQFTDLQPAPAPDVARRTAAAAEVSTSARLDAAELDARRALAAQASAQAGPAF